LRRDQAISATLWSGADLFMRQGLSFVISVVLARLITPQEFGTVALLAMFTGIASAFVDSGFSAALIQRQDTTHAEESTVFWFNLGLGALTALLLWLCAPWIARFYQVDVLVPLCGAFAFNMFVSAAGAIHGTLLTKRLEFRLQMKVGVVASTVSGVVAVVMAAYDCGIWALAAQTIVATLITTLLLWCWNPWRPAWTFELAAARKLFGFGSYMLASGLLDVLYNRLYTVLIGKLYGPRDLAFYNRAEGTKQLPVGLLTGVLSRVAFPIFSAAAGDVPQLRRGVQLALRGMMLINVPMMLGLAAVAEPLVLTLFGAQWSAAIRVLQILCLGGVFWPLHVINLNVLIAQGQSRLFFRLEILKKLIGFPLLAAGTFWGVIGIAWVSVAFAALAFVINSHYTERFLSYGLQQQVRDFLPVVAISAPMAYASWWVSTSIHTVSALRLAAGTGTGVVAFIASAWLFRLSAFHDAITMMRGFLAKTRTAEAARA
jgi:O-antigen/teichoic acid export membrane protein